MKLLVAIILLFTFTIQAAFADNAVTVKEGFVVPKEYNQGTLMDKEKAEKVRDELIEKDVLQKTNDSLNKSILIYKSNEEIFNNQKDMLIKQNIALTETLNDSRETSGWVKAGYFVLGVAVTGLAVWGASKAINK